MKTIDLAAAIVLTGSIGGGLSAQELRITSIQTNGAMTWTSPYGTSSVTILTRTNLSVGSWLPLQHLFRTGAVCSTTIARPPEQITSFYRIAATDITSVPSGIALIPAGLFQMGDSYSEGFANARPVHEVNVSSFYMDRFEISNERMREVLQWAYDHGLVGATSATVTNSEGVPKELVDLNGDDHGYPYTHLGFANGVFSIASGRENFPCSGVTWHGAQAYCNYRSDMEGLPRCISFVNWDCDFTKPGYRLPTEAEWEKAARGGLTGNHYPWESYGGIYSQHINGSRANYNGTGDPYEPWCSPVGYYDGHQVPAGTDMANGYGLYDMAGNVWEWCWDAWQADWYAQPGATVDNTRGPIIAPGFQYVTTRVIRGGSVGYGNPVYLTCACRHTAGFSPLFASAVVGFRSVRGL